MIPARRLVLLLALPLLLAGCGSSAPSLPKLNMFGSDGAPAATASVAPAPPPPATPEQRAAQVGATAARAVKCGYNFDPARMRASYLAFEAQSGTPVEQIGKAERAYDTINAKVAKEIAADQGYCTDAKTREIKADLTRHLAGDYEPPPQKQVAQSGGIFGGIFDSACTTCEKKLTADSFWDKTGEVRPRR